MRKAATSAHACQDVTPALAEFVRHDMHYLDSARVKIVKIEWPGDELTPSEIDQLVAKLDSLRDEPGIRFSTTDAALTHLRSISKRK